MNKTFPCLILCMSALAGICHAAAQIEQFTYQGRLQLNGQPANGSFPMAFTLFDASTGGNQVGSTITLNPVSVSDGAFAANLSYPGAFTGTQLWLDITVNGQALAARQAITTTPVAQFAMNGGSALYYNNPSPSSAASPPVTTLATVGPFTFKATCTLGASNEVNATLSVSSTSNYDLSEIITAQTNDTGALSSDPAQGLNVNGANIDTTTVSSGSFFRIWVSPTLFHSLGSPAVNASVPVYMVVDARPASRSCLIEGVATLGM
jgi:hypothetical protein